MAVLLGLGIAGALGGAFMWYLVGKIAPRIDEDRVWCIAEAVLLPAIGATATILFWVMKYGFPGH